MTGKHVGKKPLGQLYRTDNPFVYREKLSSGGYKLWNAKTLNTGCDKTIDNLQFKDGLIYCPHCDLMCNEDQFIIEGE